MAKQSTRDLSRRLRSDGLSSREAILTNARPSCRVNSSVTDDTLDCQFLPAIKRLNDSRRSCRPCRSDPDTSRHIEDRLRRRVLAPWPSTLITYRILIADRTIRSTKLLTDVLVLLDPVRQLPRVSIIGEEMGRDVPVIVTRLAIKSDPVPTTMRSISIRTDTDDASTCRDLAILREIRHRHCRL